ncbi:MAG: hypothetical protein WCO36_07880, partial [Actinomycetes bacterium]
MTRLDGARRASALYSNLSKTSGIRMDNYNALFQDPGDENDVVDNSGVDEDSRRRAVDRAIQDLRAIGVETTVEVRGNAENRYLTLKKQSEIGEALTLSLTRQQNDLRLNLATWLRRLHPNNGVRFDEGALAKQYLHNQVEIGYNGEIFQG